MRIQKYPDTCGRDLMGTQNCLMKIKGHLISCWVQYCNVYAAVSRNVLRWKRQAYATRRILIWVFIGILHIGVKKIYKFVFLCAREEL